MTLYLLDSYAWVEYFMGSGKGEKVRVLFAAEGNEFLTAECCLAEIKGWSLRENRPFEQLFRIIRANSRIVAVTEHDWIDAAQERHEQRKTQPDFGLIDAVLLVKQKEFNGTIVSGDRHFEKLKGVVFLK